MAYLRNCWYVAGWASEVAQAPVRRQLLGEQVVLYRGAGGVAVAASNICPHRFAFLHLGKVVDGAIECPYHGLRFNGEGRCVSNPDGDGVVPPAARLKTYPLVERLGALWIWMGDPEKADPAMIPDFHFMDDPGFRAVTGYLQVEANYRLICDNVMDHAHLHMVHNTTLACDTIRRARTMLVRKEDGSIWGNRLGENGPIPAIFDMIWRTYRGDYDPSQMDHWVDAGWYPPAFIIDDTGVGLHGRPRSEGLETKNAHLLTPETENSTHYFWVIARDFDLDNAELDANIRQGTEHAFVHEDEPMVEAVHAAMAGRDFWEMRPALMHSDVALVQLRRTLDRMIADERTQQAADGKAQDATN